MSRIFATGDTHGTTDILKIAQLNTIGLTEDDYAIIVGDFGVPWASSEETLAEIEDRDGPRLREHEKKLMAQRWERDQRLLDWYGSRPWTTLFVDGNHDNHNELAKLPAVDWHGGKAGILRENVLHLKRGQIYEIEGLTFFAMGGASSVDKAFRTEDLSWWEAELPSEYELEQAEDTLSKLTHGVPAGNRIPATGDAMIGGAPADREAGIAETGTADAERPHIDVVLTHCPPRMEAERLLESHGHRLHPDWYMDWLEDTIARKVDFGMWLYGHMHFDAHCGRYYSLYNEVIEIPIGRIGGRGGEKDRGRSADTGEADSCPYVAMKSLPGAIARARELLAEGYPEPQGAIGYSARELAGMHQVELDELQYAAERALTCETFVLDSSAPPDDRIVFMDSQIPKITREILRIETEKLMGWDG